MAGMTELLQSPRSRQGYIALDSPLEHDEVYHSHTPSSLIRPLIAPNIQGLIPVGSPPARTKSSRFVRATLKCSRRYSTSPTPHPSTKNRIERMPYGRPMIRLLRKTYPTVTTTPQKSVQNTTQNPAQNRRLLLLGRWLGSLLRFRPDGFPVEPEWSNCFTSAVFAGVRRPTNQSMRAGNGTLRPFRQQRTVHRTLRQTSTARPASATSKDRAQSLHGQWEHDGTGPQPDTRCPAHRSCTWLPRDTRSGSTHCNWHTRHQPTQAEL